MAAVPEQTAETGTELLRQINKDAYDLRIEAHNFHLECRASIAVHDVENSITPDGLINLLSELEITETVNLERLAEFCTEAASGDNPENFLLAAGREPAPGKDGYFELLVDTGGKDIQFEEDEQGRVDFKNIQDFSNVEVDQQIGTIFPPKRGTPGQTITGKEIAAPLGEPAKIVAGDGVELREENSKAFALKAGRVTFENNVLAIAEEFVVTGDVDLKVGHVNFNGFVDIKGDVLDDFNIRASKGINVTGAVGACTLESDGSITLGTMAGMGLGTIRCKGDLTARYLNHVTVECWGNINITNEVRNSIIKATGAINVPSGLITGGQAVALEGIEAKLFGSKSGVKTYLTSGIYFPEADRLHFLKTRLKSIAYQLKKISETLPALQSKPLDKMRTALREAIEMRIDILNERQTNITAEQDALSAELNEFQSEEHPTANAKINILTSMKEGVIISLGETTEEIKMEINGPVSLIENSKRGGIRQLTLSPLNVTANRLEEEALQEDAGGAGADEAAAEVTDDNQP